MSYIISTSFNPDVVVKELAEKRGQTYIGQDIKNIELSPEWSYHCKIGVPNATSFDKLWTEAPKMVSDIVNSYIIATDADSEFMEKAVPQVGHELWFKGKFNVGMDKYENYWIHVPFEAIIPAFIESTPQLCGPIELMRLTLLESYKQMGIEKNVEIFVPLARVERAFWINPSFKR